MTGGAPDAEFSCQLNILTLVGAVGALSDGQLLQRFLIHRDESSQAAFSALADRHGPMVLHVCRQILGDSHEAQDAFQATFMVLACKASSIRKADSVASWLHGVARKISMRAKADANRRRSLERRGAELRAAERNAETSVLELWPELHEEIAILPTRYQEPVILCYLEGLSVEAAAARIGCPRGTVLSRLARARERLRRQLIRRGLILPAAFVATATTLELSKGALTPSLFDATTQALWFAKRQTNQAASASASKLARGMLFTMTISKLKALGLATAILAIIGLGTGSLVRSAATPPPQEPSVARGEGAAAATRVEVSTDDLIEVTGLDIYKFRMDFVKGQRFHIMYRVQESNNSQPRVLHDWPFQVTEEGPATIRVSFLRLDRKLQGFLLSNEPEGEYRLECSRCTPSGVATIVPNPLGTLEPTRRLVTAHESIRKDGEGNGEAVLLRILANDTAKGADIKAYPRGEVVVIKER